MTRSPASSLVMREQGDLGEALRLLREPIVPLFLTIVGLALWLVSLPQIDPHRLDDFGLVSILPWTAWASAATILAAFVLSLRPSLAASQFPALPLAALALFLHATPAISYGTLRYSWAWKHIGIIDYIQRHGGVDPLAPFLAVYHNWPGFFLAGASFARLFDLDPIALSNVARFTPTVLSLLYLCALPPLLRSFTDDGRLVWTAVLIFLTGNWVGQDYFSPQGTSFLLYLVILALCVRGLTRPVAAAATPGMKARRWIDAIASRGEPKVAADFRVSNRVIGTLAVLFLIIVVTTTHQLTPVVLIFALACLAALGRISFTLVVYAVLVEVFWLCYGASPFVAQAVSEVLTELGNTGPEILDRMIDHDAVSRGQEWVSLVSRALTLAVGIAAVAGGIRRLRAGFRDGAAIVLALAPIMMLVVTSYGGEIMFRVYMFALPFLSFFAAALLFPKPSSGRGRGAGLLLFGMSMVLTAGFIIANNGKDRQYYFTPSEIEAARWLYENAPPHSLLVEGARSYPSQFINYENFSYIPISEEREQDRLEILRDPAEVLGRWLDDPRWRGGYVIITRSQKAYVDDLGVMPRGSLDRLEQALLASPRFSLVKANPDAKIFVLNSAAQAAGA